MNSKIIKKSKKIEILLTYNKWQKKVDKTIKDLTYRLPITEIDPDLPRLPFSLICTARSESGKTNICMNILQHYSKYFKNNTYIFQESPCKTTKKNLIDNKKFNGIRWKNIFDKRGNNILEAIFKQQKNILIITKTPQWFCYILMIFV